MRSSTLYSLVALAFVSACSREIAAPNARPVGVGHFTKLASGHGISNSQKYHDTGLHPATGRSGSASLEARALLGMDGNTYVEASTGSLEGGTHSGTIAKAQLKAGGTAQNFNGLTNTGYWSTSAPNLSRGQPVQVQANVRGIDPRRTDVVTVSTQVARRPDVAVLSVNAPDRSQPNVPVNISGVVTEQNTDVGARADCVLSINGTDVDHADGIWVDAGGTVSCMFNYTFVTAGTYEIRITAANVTPSDWDTANNSASRPITVETAGGNIKSGWLQAYETNVHYTYGNDYRYATGQSNHWEETRQQTISEEYMNAYDDKYAAQPIQSGTATVTMNGNTVRSTTLTPYYQQSYDDGYSYKYACTYLVGSGTAQSYGQVCSYTFYGNYPPQTNYWADVARGSITYFGHQIWCDYYGCNTYVWNGAYQYGDGNTDGLTEGSVIGLNFTFTDADNIDRTVSETLDPLIRYDYGPWNDYSYCYPSGGDTYCYFSTGYSGTQVYNYKGWYHP